MTKHLVLAGSKHADAAFYLFIYAFASKNPRYALVNESVSNRCQINPLNIGRRQHLWLLPKTHENVRASVMQGHVMATDANFSKRLLEMWHPRIVKDSSKRSRPTSSEAADAPTWFWFSTQPYWRGDPFTSNVAFATVQLSDNDMCPSIPVSFFMQDSYILWEGPPSVPTFYPWQGSL